MTISRPHTIHQSWWILMSRLFFPIVIVFVVAYFLPIDKQLHGVPLLFIFLCCTTLYIFLRWYVRTISITHEYISLTSGIIHKEIQTYSLENLQIATVETPGLGFFLQYATLHLELDTYSEGKEEIHIHYIPNAAIHAEFLQQIIIDNNRHPRVRR